MKTFQQFQESIEQLRKGLESLERQSAPKQRLAARRATAKQRIAEDIEQRRQELRQRQLDKIGAYRERVANYQKTQKEKIATQIEAQKQKQLETQAAQREAQEAKKAERKQKEEARREERRQRERMQQREELQLEQTPTMKPNLYSQLVARRQASQKSAIIKHAHQEMGAEARAQEAAHQRRLSKLTGTPWELSTTPSQTTQDGVWYLSSDEKRSMDDFDDFQIEEISGFDFAEASFDGFFGEDDEDQSFNTFLKSNYDYWNLIRHHFITMTPDTLNFTGDFTTVLGFVGITSAFVIVVTAFRRFFNSPYNVRVNTQSINETPELYTETNDWHCKCSPTSSRTSTNLEAARF